MSTRLLRRLGRGVFVFRSPVPSRRLPFRAGTIQRQVAFHHLPVMYRGPLPIGAIQEECWDEETECRFLYIGADPEQVHPAIWQGILQGDLEKLRNTIAAIPEDEREMTLWLHLAIEAGNEAAAALFMSAGADMAQMYGYHGGGRAAAPYRAIHKHMMELVRRMWEVTEDVPDPRPGNGGIRRNWWLAVAAECGHADMVEDMLGWSTDWDYDCALS
ncbi:ankyrin repeats (3 copies) domain-containing protein [Pochonia chlamydosporia 170]|uniref:Ankyrin repeats (3 copies) domain-containing protein n=1 Tax=Pochonia chlamydosporia 170 TaxID=1380566 RepID=A0A179FIZ1_METCM|nr:ankyrin repeats (3 copies) domain-containing protein [Pochonia chlamydosporia 170]OAQ65268.1 ankyrin repeats (3 copies) domain-containing protein [Pochonia chlamydosporia 170]